MRQLEIDRKMDGTESMIRIKGYFNPLTQTYQFGKIYIGLNCIAREAQSTKGILAIPLPFITRNYGIVRYKKFIPGPNYTGLKIRVDQETKRLETLKLKHRHDDNFQTVADMILSSLKYIKDGPYDPNRE